CFITLRCYWYGSANSLLCSLSLHDALPIFDTIPPTIGAAIRFIVLLPTPVPHMIGSRPAMIASTVIILGRTRSTAPSRIAARSRSEEHTSELQSRENLVCRLLLETKKPAHS